MCKEHRQELHNLHDGNVARYRLALGEYKRWGRRQEGASD